MNQNRTVVVIDDEPLAVSRATRMIADIDGYQLVGTAGNHLDAVKAVETLQPDVVLLDIEMPGENGLEVAATLADKASKTPSIIFCTAYEHYAIDAFKTLASGYLLKPIKLQELETALHKAAQLEATQTVPADHAYITVQQDRDSVRLALSDILYFSAKDKLVFAKCQGGGKTETSVIDKSLDQLEQELGETFLRVHRNCLVATQHVKRHFKDGTGQNWLALGDPEVPVQISRRNLARAKQLFD